MRSLLFIWKRIISKDHRLCFYSPQWLYKSGDRLLVAIRRFNSCVSLTEIAHDAGFADLAHFSHAFRSLDRANYDELVRRQRAWQC